MDHPCETCAHPVEDGIPFCPHCRAPQIRVVVIEAEDSGSTLGRSDSSSFAFHPNSIQWALALPVCASAGILAGFLMALVGPSILWMLAAGFLSVVFYRRRHPAINPSARTGARLGGAAGVVGLAVFFAAAVYNGLLREMLSQTVNFYSTMKTDPRFKDVAQSSIESLRRPGGFGAWVFFISLVMFVFFVIGGALGAAILGRRDRK
jgi:hypothetical protein